VCLIININNLLLLVWIIQQIFQWN
jgi:hypothetical protein